ncbi:hypothetical protein BGZ88_005845, partial [Linnemannia elongata]
MEPIPSNTNQLTVPEVADDDPIMSDKLALALVEQVVVNGLNELGEHMAKEEAAERDGDKDQVDIKKDDIKSEADLELLKARIAEGLDGVVLSRIRGVLYCDTEILDSAKHFKHDPDFPFIMLDADVAEFYIRPDRFPAWLADHQRSISTNFVRLRKYEFNDPDRQYRLSFACHRAGKKRVNKGDVTGGVSGRTRMRKAGIKKDCPSRIAALFRPILLPDGSSVPGCIVEYRYQHNHSIGEITDIGTRQKSAAIKATIERLLKQGSTIHRVMQQLTMDYDKFTQITRGNGQQLSRDEFITYDDVYNIWHRITTAAMRKDPDP